MSMNTFRISLVWPKPTYSQKMESKASNQLGYFSRNLWYVFSLFDSIGLVPKKHESIPPLVAVGRVHYYFIDKFLWLLMTISELLDHQVEHRASINWAIITFIKWKSFVHVTQVHRGRRGRDGMEARTETRLFSRRKMGKVIEFVLFSNHTSIAIGKNSIPP